MARRQELVNTELSIKACTADGGGDPDPAGGMAKIRNRRILNKSILTQLIKRILVRLTPGFRHAAAARTKTGHASKPSIYRSRSLAVCVALVDVGLQRNTNKKHARIAQRVGCKWQAWRQRCRRQRHKAKQCSHIRLSLFRFEQHNTCACTSVLSAWRVARTRSVSI